MPDALLPPSLRCLILDVHMQSAACSSILRQICTQLPFLTELDLHMPSICWPSSAPTPFPRTLRNLRLDCSYAQQRAESAAMEHLIS